MSNTTTYEVIAGENDRELEDRLSTGWQYNYQRNAWELFASPFCAVVDTALEIDEDSDDDEEPEPTCYYVDHAEDESDGGCGYDQWSEISPVPAGMPLAEAMANAEARMGKVRAELEAERRSAVSDAWQAVGAALPRDLAGNIAHEMEGLADATATLAAAVAALAAVA